MRSESGETPQGASKFQGGARDGAVGDLAQRQFGVFSLDQAWALGFSPTCVRSRVARGRWRRVHRGVYSFGHSVLVPNGRLLAAVLACGDGAALSDRSAARLWGLANGGLYPVHVTVPGQAGRSIRGILSHQSRLGSEDRAIHEGIAVTSVARTLLDFCVTADDAAAAGAVEEAEKLRLFDLRAVERLLTASAGRPGSARLRRAIAANVPQTVTRSVLERAFRALCARAQLPPPLANHEVVVPGDTFEVDAVWPAARLAVELDSRAHHLGAAAFDRDRRRDRLLTLAGWRPLRYTWLDVNGRAAATTAELALLLGVCGG